MRVTIIRDDGVVGIDGLFRQIDLSALPPEIRAVQWSGVSGHIEYDNAANISLQTITGFQWIVDRWIATAPQPSTTLGGKD